MGYAGGGLLLAINFGLVTAHDTFGLTEGMAARISMLSAAIWWAAFTFIPFRGIKNRPPVNVEAVEGGLFSRSFGQLWATLKEMRHYPVALTFLVAYLFFNDGIQTVISQASLYGTDELGLQPGHRAGDVPAGPVRRRRRRHRVRPGGGNGRQEDDPGRPRDLDGHRDRPHCFCPQDSWCRSCCSASRSASSSAAPRRWPGPTSRCSSRQARRPSYFSIYHAMDRGTSWFGTLVFGLVYIAHRLATDPRSSP